jgi:2-keto-4-pentenoate hydratase/2-oxohepta-3-ene-1,7-dioic acid hydratase in catechol pathway
MAYKLLTHETSDGPRAAILVGDRVFDAAAVSGRPDYSTALGVLNDWAAADQLFASVSGEGRAKKGGSAPERGIAPEGGIALEGGGIAPAGGIALEGVKLLAPILYPGQIFAAGANYEDHIAEMGKSEFKAQNARKAGGRPWHFGKSSRSAVIGHGSIRPLPPYSRKVDWEIELAVVIGREATRIPAGRALEYVAGYTIANDLSARDFVVRDGIEANSPFRFDWISHKGFDGACPLGPWITPARDIPDPQSLALKLWVDGEEMQNSNTRQMIFSVAEQIEELSARVTLNPGDLILTGTPSGVGMGRNLFLKPGQRLRLWIENIGELHHGFA